MPPSVLFGIFGYDFGFFEARLEVNGAGVASVISSYAGVIGMLIWSLRAKIGIHSKFIGSRI